LQVSDKYVLVKSYYGLGGDLCVLIGAMQYAERTHRSVLVDWNGGVYGSVASGSLHEALFEAPSFGTSAELHGRTFNIFPPVWQDRLQLPPLTYLSEVDLTVSRPEEVPADCDADCVVITRDSKRLTRQPELFYPSAKRLKPVAAVRDAVAALRQQMGQTRPSIGIHYRHGNGERKVIPPDPRWFRNRINARLRALNLEPADIDLFVATDCKGALDYFSRYYPSTFASKKPYRPNGAGAMHVGRDDLDDAAKLTLAHEALIDMYSLAGCTYFVGSQGYFSLFVQLLYEGARLFNNYAFSDSFRPVTADPVMSAALRQARQTPDGLFVRIEENQRRLVYYDEPLYAVGTDVSKLTIEQVQEMRRAIIARRTY
jgi:hypothetical protein